MKCNQPICLLLTIAPVAALTVFGMLTILSPPTYSRPTPNPLPPPNTTDSTPLTFNGRLDANSETLNDGSYYNEHTFEGTAGQAIAIEMTSPDFDAYLILLDPQGDLRAENDDGLRGTNAQIVIRLPEAGRYTVLASSYDRGETGNYQLQIRAATANDLALADAEQLDQRANQLSEQQRYEEALSLYQRSLQIREQVLGENHLDVATNLNQIGFLYYSQGNYAQAEPVLLRSLHIREQVLGENHPDVATSLNDLALVYKTQGNYTQAEPLYQRSLRIREQVLGENHPSVAASLNNLAALYRALGNSSQAEPLYQRSLRIREQILGENHPDVAVSLNGLALLYEDQGNYTQAEPLLLRALRIREQTLGENHFDVAVSLNNLAELYRLQGNYTQAEELYQRSLHIKERILGENHPSVAISLNNLAALYEDQGNYIQAESLMLRSLHIREQVLGENHPDVASSLNNLAALYRKLGNYTQAEALYQRSLRIAEQTLGEGHPDVAQTRNNLAVLYQIQGNYPQAEQLYQRSLQLSQQTLGEEHRDVAIARNNLAALYQTQGNYAEAETLYQRSLHYLEQALGSNHPDVATTLNNLAGLYTDQGNYAEAETLYQQSLHRLEQSLGGNHPDVATALNNLAGLYRTQGNYAEAEPLYQRSLQILDQPLGNYHPNVANTLNNLAELYRVLGNYAEAEPLYQRSLQLIEQAFGENHPDIATSLNNLALLYENQGEYERAELLLLRSLHIQEQALGSNHPNVAESLSTLGNLYQREGNYTQAEPLLLRSLHMREQVLGVNHPDVAKSLNNLATLYHRQRQYAQAESLYQRSLRIFEQMVGEQHPDVAVSLSNLTALHLIQGRYSQALPLFSQALSVEETNLEQTLSIGSEVRKRAFVAMLDDTTDVAISMHLQYTATNMDAAELALTTLLRRKGRVLDAMTDTVQRLRQNLNPSDQALLSQLQTKQSQLANLLYSGLGNLDPEIYRTQVTALRSQIETLENTLAQHSAAFRVESQPVTLKAVAEQIPDDSVVIEWVRYRPYTSQTNSGGQGEPHYAAYLLDAQGNVQGVDLGEAAVIDELVSQYLDALRRRSFRIEDIARQLDAQIMQPIRRHIGTSHHLMLSPDGPLNLIPFAALVDENNRYLIETYTLTYLTSGRDLLRFQHTTPSRQPPVIIANPDFDSPGSLTSSQLASASSGASTRGAESSSNQRSVDLATQTFGPLSGTEQEANAILSLFPNAELLSGSLATENTLKQLHSPSILHIATHGFFFRDVEFIPPPDSIDQDAPTSLFALTTRTGEAQAGSDRAASSEDRPISNENPLLRSGLALAGFNPRRSGSEDGVLTALEASGLDLRGTQLVVLSACDTGLGDVVNGEGVYGLRRAFFMAGAESQLMSLWKVDDYATSTLMTHYYERLQQGGDRSEAFRQVQLELLQTPEYRHPYFWAAFVFSGNWRNLEVGAQVSFNKLTGLLTN